MGLLKSLGYRNEDRAWLVAALNRRAAEWLQVDGQWEAAVECWAAAGELDRAIEMCLQSSNPVWKASMFLSLRLWDEAISCHRGWLDALVSGDIVGEVRARLGLAVALARRGDPEDAEEARLQYRQARAMIEAESGAEVWRTARCWEALGEYGVYMGLLDCVQIGYERAMSSYGERYPGEQIRVGQLYWKAVEHSNPLLAVDLAGRILKWNTVISPRMEMDWVPVKVDIDSRGFRQGNRDVCHFAEPDLQMLSWSRLAKLEFHSDQPAIDEYLQTLAPPGMDYIPAGSFLMGSLVSDPLARAEEFPQHEVDLAGYYLNRRLVTNCEYEGFVRSGGYRKEEYWVEAHLHGHWNSMRGVRGASGWRLQPAYWNRAGFDRPDAPVVGVNWYEAWAYARWRNLRLPTEAEWEKAVSWDAESRLKRRYPWGEVWDEKSEAQARRIRFFSWCNSKWAGYPYREGDGREDRNGEIRTVRGVDGRSGKADLLVQARCAARGKREAVEEDAVTGIQLAGPFWG